MNKFLLILLPYILFFFNTNLISLENNKLKIGLLAPFSGSYKELGDSMMFSLQLALKEINDENVIIVPRDTGSNNKQKLNNAIQEIIDEGAKVIIGPLNYKDFNEAYKYPNVVFISLSNINSEVRNNVISVGVNLESQLIALKKFLKKENKKKTLILYPKNSYTKLIDEKIEELNLEYFKIFKYSSDPKILTGQIEKVTNYPQRKRNLEYRKKTLLKKEDYASKKELEKLEQKYTLGSVNFDSIIVIDFGSSLKSILTTLIFLDVNQSQVLYTTVNQWFDESIFEEKSLKTLYYPSINYKNFQSFRKNYQKNFNSIPGEISILAYDAIGLIYYVWKKNKKINSVTDFLIKEKIKGKIGNFSFNNNRTIQSLKIYKAEDKSFTKF